MTGLRAFAGRLVAAFLLIPFLPPEVAAGREVCTTVTVLTSFPAGFYEPVREAFEAAHPDRRLRVVNTKTTAALSCAPSAGWSCR